MSELRPGRIVDIERIGIAEADAEMRRLQGLRIADQIPDTFLFVEHPEVVTIGRRAQVDGFAVPPGYETFLVDRGGGLTWHGPGQVVVYPIVAWTLPGERSVRSVLDKLEAWMLAALAKLGVEGNTDPRMRGVWLGERKVGSIGVAFSHWVSRHGLSINYATPPGRVELLDCCGLAEGTTTSIEAVTGKRLIRAEVQAAMLETLEAKLGRRIGA